MIQRLFLILVVVGALGGCGRSSANWTVLREALSFSGYWRCDEVEIAEAVAGSRMFLSQLKVEVTSEYRRREIEKILAHWDDYTCQVVCHTKNGRRMIHLNFVPREEAKAEYVSVMDGGFWYWRIEYDYEDRRYVDFRSNGYA